MITTDTGAKKLEGTDNWRQIIQAHNDSVDAHDAGIEGLQDALGIVVDGDQAAVSASTGQYIILKNSTITGCTDGLYTATKAIPANTAIDNTYLSAVSGGGLNALNTQLTDMDTVSNASGFSGSSVVSDISVKKYQRFVVFKGYVNVPTSGVATACYYPLSGYRLLSVSISRNAGQSCDWSLIKLESNRAINIYARSALGATTAFEFDAIFLQV